MFTGIIESIGFISQARTVPAGRRLSIQVPSEWTDVAPGASIAVNGTCLTVAARGTATLEFDVVTETLDRTTLGESAPGDRVNLERSLRIGDRLDGHFVQGHIEGTAIITRILSSPREWVVWLTAPESLRSCIVPKGGVALEGVSLTIADVRDGEFSVALIPTTLQRTTWDQRRIGDRVNIETDIITRTVVHRLAALQESPGITVKRLREAGFL